MRHIIPSNLLAAALALALATTSAMAATNSNYAPGDLVLFFQQEGGTKTVYANLGNAATIYRGTAAGASDGVDKLNIVNINSELTTAFGSGWASDPTVYAGLAGVWSDAAGITTLQNGDPTRTLYVSSPRNSVGTLGAVNSTGWDLSTAGNNAISTAATGITVQNNVLEEQFLTAVAVSPNLTSQIDDMNPFFAPGLQDAAFQGGLAGGVQQVGTAGTFGIFGSAGTVEFALDLFRIVARNNLPGQVPGVVRIGSYEGTVVVASNGSVSFIAQGPTSTPLQTWALTFPALDTAAKRLPDADPDNDGLTNLMEFVLNGNPGTSDPSVAPTLNATGTDFIFSFNRRDDSEAGSTLLFQYGTDLVGWSDVTVGASGSVVGAATVVVTENSTNPDVVSVTVPKSAAPGGKLFGRLKVSQP